MKEGDRGDGIRIKIELENTIFKWNKKFSILSKTIKRLFNIKTV